MPEEITKKEQIWKELKGKKKGSVINMVQLSKKVGCSLAYLSAMFRYALESDFLQFHDNGNYAIKNIPNYPDFKEVINKKYTQYRKSTKTGTPRGRIKTPPKDFKVDEETIIGVIKQLIQNKKELEEKLEKVVRYARKIKSERDELLESFENVGEF